jgi:hypothetical protein
MLVSSSVTAQLVASQEGLTLYLILREEYGLRMFENRVLRRVFGPKGDEVTVLNEELRNLYSSHFETRPLLLQGLLVERSNKPKYLRRYSE